MAFTYQSVVDRARDPLNDADKVRYPDAQLLRLANDAMMMLCNRRPDLFIGQFGSTPTGEAALTDLLPLPPVHVVTLANYVTAMAEMVDDENADSGRAAAFMQLLGAEVPA